MTTAPPTTGARPDHREVHGRALLRSAHTSVPFSHAMQSAIESLHRAATKQGRNLDGRIRVKVTRGTGWSIVKATATGWKPTR